MVALRLRLFIFLNPLVKDLSRTLRTEIWHAASKTGRGLKRTGSFWFKTSSTQRLRWYVASDGCFHCSSNGSALIFSVSKIQVVVMVHLRSNNQFRIKLFINKAFKTSVVGNDKFQSKSLLFSKRFRKRW
jgi:hypothetical protein